MDFEAHGHVGFLKAYLAIVGLPHFVLAALNSPDFQGAGREPGGTPHSAARKLGSPPTAVSCQRIKHRFLSTG